MADAGSNTNLSVCVISVIARVETDWFKTPHEKEVRP